MATGAVVIERVSGSVDALFEQAKPPHFLQMHAGDYNVHALQDFADQHPDIEAWQIHKMVGYDGAAVSWQRPATGQSGSLSESLMDNLFVTQNPEFDLLLGQDGTAVQPGPGQVFIPVAYQKQYGLQKGDSLTVAGTDTRLRLTVAGSIRDAQMASSMSSSTRFVVSDTDFQQLASAHGGAAEIIVEYRLSDPSLIPEFQRSYETRTDLPHNGQAVTYPLIRLFNTLSDGLVAVALVGVSAVLILIALLNLRFVIRGSIQDDVRQIGAMKAMGLAPADIRGMYLAKYRVLSLLGCVLGAVLSVPAAHWLTRSVAESYAQAGLTVVTVLLPVVAVILVHLVVMTVSRVILRQINRVEVVTALMHGSTLPPRQRMRNLRAQRRAAHRTRLIHRGWGSTTMRLAWLDIRTQRRQWALLPVVFALAVVVITVPTNLLTTLTDPRFVTHMGSPQADVRADIQFGNDLDAVQSDLTAAMDQDARLDNVRTYANLRFETLGSESAGEHGANPQWETLRVEVGDYSRGTVDFLTGQAPGDGHIALSALNAEKLGVQVGDQLPVRRDGVTHQVPVSGVYQDLTSGGYTAKMQGQLSADADSYVVLADLATPAKTNDDDAATAIAQEYNQRFTAAEVRPLEGFLRQSLSYVTDAVRTTAWLALAFGLLVAALITTLFLKLRLARDAQQMGVLRAVGFSPREVRSQVIFKVLVAATPGVVIGAVAAHWSGQGVVGALLSQTGLGFSHLTFLVHPVLVWGGYPVALLTVGVGCAAVAARAVGLNPMSAQLKEQ
ncbi:MULTISPECIES: ABC transporter permease [Kocuria]|uniref:ABC transporter permease n=1 Tax=Kocuria subflava TaxID=1736139 RepID=A0A846TSJ1_9MICC|nr:MULTISPECIES: FtsX-like permease family protein [Kocuria]NKE09940.1 ABC transporter permease [Kocuria subflava]